MAFETATSEDITEMGDFSYELTSAKSNARNIVLLDLFSVVLCGDISVLRQYPNMNRVLSQNRNKYK